jgi:hypothetical protein
MPKLRRISAKTLLFGEPFPSLVHVVITGYPEMHNLLPSYSGSCSSSSLGYRRVMGSFGAM